MPKSAVNEISRGVFQLGHGPDSVILRIKDNKLSLSRQPAKLRQEGSKAKNLVLEVEGSVAATEGAPGDGTTGTAPSPNYLTDKDMEELFK